MKRSVLIIFVVGFSISLMAEFRTWTDQNGNCLEADFAGTDGDEIILNKKEGGELTVAPQRLSDEDLEYLKGKIPDQLLARPEEAPPPLQIEFKRVTDTDNQLDDPALRDIHMVSRLKIIRKSGVPYSGHLTAYMYVIGHNRPVDGYVLLDSRSYALDLKNNSELNFSGTNFIIREDKDDWNNYTQYAGYVVVILDEQGNVVAKKSSAEKFDESYKQFEKYKRGTVFNWQFYKKRGAVGDVRYE